jgi:hypothetical protein
MCPLPSSAIMGQATPSWLPGHQNRARSRSMSRCASPPCPAPTIRLPTRPRGNGTARSAQGGWEDGWEGEREQEREKTEHTCGRKGGREAGSERKSEQARERTSENNTERIVITYQSDPHVTSRALAVRTRVLVRVGPLHRLLLPNLVLPPLQLHQAPPRPTTDLIILEPPKTSHPKPQTLNSLNEESHF